jgi:hypothetical protein
VKVFPTSMAGAQRARTPPSGGRKGVCVRPAAVSPPAFGLSIAGFKGLWEGAARTGWDWRCRVAQWRTLRREGTRERGGGDMNSEVSGLRDE